MKNTTALIFPISLIIAAIIACGVEPSPGQETITTHKPTSAQPEVNARPRGDRLLGIDVNEMDNGDFEKAFALAMDSGLDFVSLTIYWDDFETAPGVFAPETNWLEIADSYYAAAGIGVALVIAVVDTSVIHTPDDLRGLAFDEPVMAERFNSFLDYALTQLTSVELISISIGNEIDAFLGSDQAAWEAYQTFYASAVDHIHASHPDYRVGVKSMFDGLAHSHISELDRVNQHSDVILVTYYPLQSDFSVRPASTVFADFELVTRLYPSKPVYFLETGYPSSKELGSSEFAQAEFVQNVFRAWDQHATGIKAVNFTWLHDITPSDVKEYSRYYGINNPSFRAYLATLGLRHSDGTDKDAFIQLQQEAAARGW